MRNNNKILVLLLLLLWCASSSLAQQEQQQQEEEEELLENSNNNNNNTEAGDENVFLNENANANANATSTNANATTAEEDEGPEIEEEEEEEETTTANTPSLTTLSPLACETNEDCNEYFFWNTIHNIPSGVSDCLDGICTNPFAQGCLSVIMSPSPTTTSTDSDSDDDQTVYSKRVCNSDDEKDKKDNDESSRFCIQTENHHYDEIRILAGDWESSIFLGWIMQILLSEILQVPVTMETATYDGRLSFYDRTNQMAYPTVPYNFQALQTALDHHGNCTDVIQKNTADHYVACGHVMPEVWSGQINAYNQAVMDGTIEPPEGNGMVGEFSFMIPQRLAQQDPSLMSWYGLQNRTKMASLFLPPWTWLEYCTLVSPNNCTQPDDVAQRFPFLEEEGMYFLLDAFQGYFAAKEANNCTLHPDDCVGHVVDPPCDWDTLTESQMYWNNIPLKSMGPLEPNSGYSYFNMLEIYHAANATKSPVFMWWWKPDSLDQLYFNTDYALQPVYLPPPTEQCEQNRVTNEQRCSSDVMERIGLPVGSCGFPPHSLQKIISSALWKQTQKQPQAWQSPAHEFIQNFRVSDLSVTNLLADWITMEPSVDPYGLDARMAVCAWVTENIDDLMEKFIPPDYPRIYQKEVSNAIFIAALSFGIIALTAALFATAFTLKYRKSLVFRYAHVPFVLWICCGLVLVSIGSILSSLQPTDALCIAQPYFVVVGYTIELMPLVVKVAVIGHLLREAKKMRKVVMNTKVLHVRVSSVVICVLVYVIAWSIIDPLQVEETAILREQGEPYVNLSTSCASDATGWVLTTYIWQGLLLVMALILAIQNRKVKQEFNESQSLAFMVYSHTLFLVLRAMIYSLPPDNFPKSNAQAGYISLCLSLDSLNTLFVYFAPKIYVIWKKQDIASSSGNNNTSYHPTTGGNPSRGSLGAMGVGNNSRVSFGGAPGSDMFEAPAPNPVEMEELLDEALRLLSRAAETKARILSVPSSEAATTAAAALKSIGEDGDHTTISDHHDSIEMNEDNDDLEDNFFFSKPALIKLRTICTRIGRAQFDWEHSMSTSEHQGLLESSVRSTSATRSAWPQNISSSPNTPLPPRAGKQYSNGSLRSSLRRDSDSQHSNRNNNSNNNNNINNTLTMMMSEETNNDPSSHFMTAPADAASSITKQNSHETNVTSNETNIMNENSHMSNPTSHKEEEEEENSSNAGAKDQDDEPEQPQGPVVVQEVDC